MENINDLKRQQMDDSDKLVIDERNKLSSWRKIKGRKDDVWTGLALSGGGFRSSTFCLGVIQALAHKNLLKNFDYLSTVSGGGFIGTSLQWWWTGNHNIANESQKLDTLAGRIKALIGSWIGQAPQENNPDKIENVSGFGPKDFPYGTEHPDPGKRVGKDSEEQKNVLNFLRAHGYYLAPGNGINFMSGIGVVIRSILLNLIVWIPVAAFLFAMLKLEFWQKIAVPLLDYLPNDGSPIPSGLIGPGWGTNLIEHTGQQEAILLPPAFAIIVWAAFVLVALFLIGSMFHSFQTSNAVEDNHEAWTWRRNLRYLSTSAVLFGLGWWLYNYLLPQVMASQNASNIVQALIAAIAFIIATVGLSIFLGFFIAFIGVKDMGDAYRLRRNFEKIVGKFFIWFLLFLAIGMVPVVFTLAFKTSSSLGMAGIFSVAAGVGAALWAHYQTLNNILPGLAAKILLPVGSALFLFGVIVLGYEIALLVSEPQLAVASYVDGAFVDGELSQSAQNWIRFALFAIIGLAILSLFVVNTNQIGLNRFYRDRLIETFMPNVSAVNSAKVRRSPVAERMRLSESWSADGQAPYPIINTNVVLANDENRKWRLRGGDSYILSPYYCGSSATKWHSSSAETANHITLASAMAASGAAANPHAGYVGTGPTRGRLVSIVMMLLNVRLGYWIPHPMRKYLIKPTHISPGGIYTLTRYGFRSDSKYLELTDGGHFDNLGIYELIRRKLSLIVVCDGEADLGSSYSALVSVQRRIEEDFGATIIFEKHKGPELLVANKKMAYPSDTLCARLPYFLASIKYNDNSEGKIIYMKATMIDALSFKTLGYKGANRDFPHETTADQFFGPEQFEAYRELGYCTGMEMIDGLGLAGNNFNNRNNIAKLEKAFRNTVDKLEKKSP